MFLSKNKKNNVYPCKPQFYYIKVGFKGVKIISACFCDVIKIKQKSLCKPRFYYIKVGFKGVKNYIGTFLWYEKDKTKSLSSY